MFTSDGGHVKFPARSQIEDELSDFLQNRFSKRSNEAESEPNVSQYLEGMITKERARVSVEWLLSGLGLESMYELLASKYPEGVNQGLHVSYKESTERDRFIGMKQYDYGLFRKSLEIMFGTYCSELGNVALNYLPYGVFYIAGGIAPKNVLLRIIRWRTRELPVPILANLKEVTL